MWGPYLGPAAPNAETRPPADSQSTQRLECGDPIWVLRLQTLQPSYGEVRFRLWSFAPAQTARCTTMPADVDTYVSSSSLRWTLLVYGGVST